MIESALKRIEKNRKEHRRWIALILCLSMVVSLGVFSGLRKDAVAKTYTRVVLECPYMADAAAQVVHTHNDDCYDEVGNLVCTLPELEAHTHSDECYTEVRTLACGLEETPGHRHTDDCYTAETTLICGLEENEGHQHTGDCYTLERGELLCDNTDEEHEHTDACFAWNEVLSCGMEAGEGAHLHSEDCYRTEWILTCGMEEGEGAHTHTDACYLTERVLSCDKPEIVLHTHTDDCYQKNDDGSIYVDEDGYARLICGQPEIIEHVHDVNCFAVYELDDGEPEEVVEIVATDEAESATTEENEKADDPETSEEESENKDTAELNENEENKEETKDETKEENESTDTETEVPAVPMPAQSFEKTAGGIRVSVEAPEGAFPENTRMSVRPVNGSGLVDTVSDAVNGEILEVQAVDITFYDADDNEIEPATAIRVSIVPANSQYSEEKANVVHIDSEGAATAVEQAEGTTEDNSEVVFDADSFSIYAIVYTVHFEYEVDGQVYTSEVPGAQDMLLSEVLSGLNIVAEEELETFLTKISDVAVSDPDVIQLTPVEGDWSIRPLKNSEEPESLTVTMQDGAAFRITVETDGFTEVRTEDETAIIRTVNDLYLPQDATAVAQTLTEEESGSAIAAVQQAAGPDPEEVLENADDAVAAVDAVDTADTGTNYHAFSIGLENVDVESYDGFNVSVTLPEDAVVGRDFQLYQVKEDGTAADITESLAVTSQTTEDGLQAVSELSFTTDSFAEYVLSYSIETYYTTYEGDSLKISLNYGPKAGIPEGAELKVSEILPEDERYSDYLNDSVTELGVKSGAVSFARFLDIEIQKDGEKIEPQAPVSVKIEMMDLPEETGNAQAQVVHFGEQTEVLSAETVGTDVSFETRSFSVYGVVYTVDFHYEVNGQTFEFSIPGGGFISLEHLIEVLGINVSDAADIDSVTNEAIEEEYTEYGVETVAEEIEEAATAVEEAGDNVSSNAEVDAAAAYEQAINLNNVPVSEETRAFVAEIATVEFSSPQLVWVGKVDEESTVGALKEANGLEVEYSAELTEEQIGEINAQTVEAGDWALISLKAFDTEESLTITMKNGEKFVINVTDAQIQKDYITASGETYTIMVTYDNDAEIPDGADLKVREIEAGTKEFDNYLSSAASELEAQKVIFARFFDIVIADQEGNKVEPKAPVQVQICYKDPIGVSESEVLSVVHFTESSAVTAPEVITDITLSDDKTEVTYEQSSFSVTGTVVQSPTADHTYALVIHHTDGNYYVVENDGTLTQIKTEDLVFNGDGSVRSVKMINPICWTYQDIGYSNYNIWHDSDANDYDYGFTHLPTSYERRYLTTDVPEGFVDLDDDVNPWTLDNRSYCSDDGHYVNLQYNNDTHVINHYGHVLGVKQDTDGTLRICGQASEAAEIFFAEAQSVSSVSIQNHTVSHIDISVEGYSGIKVPLAYGTYRLAKVSEEDLANIDNIGDINSHIIGYRALDLVVSHGSDVTLEAERMVPITQNDIKKANIYAYTEYTGERVYLDDVYAVTGYSGNADTGGSISKAQVRLEGSFKVADMQPVTYANTEQGANDWDYWENGQNTGKSIKEVRLERKIYYTVEVEKSVTFTMTYTDPSDGQVYIVMREDGNPFRVTVDTTLSNSFHYWDDDNTCPGIDIYGRDKWKEGALYSNIDSWQYHQSGGLDVGPGFDFELGAPIDEANHDIVAIEVTKYVQGDFGDEVRTLSLREGTSCGINVYQNNSLTPLHDKTLSVGKDGIGMINDYDVTAGTYDNPAYAQISEDPDTVADTIIDAEGNKWVYDHSRVETEFAYRNNGQNNPSRYVSDDYTKENGLYYSQSEVIGEYTVQGGQPYDYNDKHYDGIHEYNRFLEFYVYNIYKPVATDITIKKVNDNNQPLSDAVFELYKHNGSKFEKVTHSTYTWLDEDDQFTVPAAGYTLTGLTDGTYQIKEIKPPDGYVITEDTPVTFTVENGTVVEASNDLKNGATYTPAQDAVEDDPDTTDTDESKEATNDTFTIPNTPGAALPNTGGPGTRLFTILGSILILGAGVLLWRRRRLI